MNNAAEFEEIYRSSIALVRKIIASFKIQNGTADDLAQQTFLQAFEKYSTLRDKSSLRSWIASIARNNCLETFRGRKFIDLDSYTSDPDSPLNEFKLGLWFDPESGEADIELEQNLALLHRLLETYKKEPRGKVARLFYLEGMTTREISEQLEMSQSTVLSHLLLFRKEMKVALLLLKKNPKRTTSPQGLMRTTCHGIH